MARPDNFQTIYLDSCVLLAVINGEPGCEPVKQVLWLADQRKLRLFRSPLTLVEVRGQRRGQREPLVEQQTLATLTGARFTDVEFHQSVALRARNYVGQHGLKPADAVHLASAVDAEVDVMWSLDSDFRGLWESRVDGVWVDRPYEFGQAALFDT